MELSKVDSLSEQESIIIDTLKTLVSSDDIEDLVSGLKISLEDDSSLFVIKEEAEVCGFFLATPLSDDESNSKVDIVSIEELWVKVKYNH